MKRISICVITGSRAEFGLLQPLLKRMEREERVELRLVVTGSHLSSAFGSTLDEIHSSGFQVDEEIPIPLTGDGKLDMVQATAEAMRSFGEYFTRRRPDCVVVLGDRYEIFGASTAAAMLCIPIAHLCGGETTEGAVDEFLRHSITKMSTLHFTACQIYRKRCIHLGEAPERVFDVGALGVENFLSIPPMTRAELEEDLHFSLDGPYCVVTFHPVTLEDSYSGQQQLQELMAAMDYYSNLRYIVTLANADAGGREINRLWQQAGASRDNWLVIPSLGARRYLSALRYASMVLGNSSSGIMEGPAAHIPTVNIGDRQKGRLMGPSILNCAPIREEIIQSMAVALSPAHQQISRTAPSPFGDGTTSRQIMDVLMSFFNSAKIEAKKSFYDLQFEV